MLFNKEQFIKTTKSIITLKEPSIISLENFYTILTKDIISIPFLIDFEQEKAYLNISHLGLLEWFKENKIYSYNLEDEFLENHDILTNTRIMEIDKLLLFRKYKNTDKFNYFIKKLSRQNIGYIISSDKQELSNQSNNTKELQTQEIKLTESEINKKELLKIKTLKQINDFYDLMKIMLDKGAIVMPTMVAKNYKGNVEFRSSLQLGQLIGINKESDELIFYNKGKGFIENEENKKRGDNISSKFLPNKEYIFKMSPKESYDSYEEFYNSLPHNFIFKNINKIFTRGMSTYNNLKERITHENNADNMIFLNCAAEKIGKPLTEIGKLENDKFTISLNYLFHIDKNITPITETYLNSPLHCLYIDYIEKNEQSIIEYKKECLDRDYAKNYFRKTKDGYIFERLFLTQATRSIIDNNNITSFGHIGGGKIKAALKNLLTKWTSKEFLYSIREHFDNDDIEIYFELKFSNNLSMDEICMC